MKWSWFVIPFFLWLMLYWFVNSITKADEITTGNLLTNGNFETGNTNGWTTSGNTAVVDDCCTLNNVASNYDLEFGDSGSISQDVELITNTITQEMLNNPISLTQVTEVQNGECGVSGCWGGAGGADTFTINLNIKDSSGNVIASMTSIRTDTTNINGANFTDTLIYTGANSNIANTTISGIDGNAPEILGGTNIDNISLTMTYNNVVLQVETKEALKKIETEKIEFKKEVQMLVTKVETIAAAPIPKKEKAIEIVAAVQTFETKTETKVTKAEIKTAVKTEEKSETIANKIIEEAKEEAPKSEKKEETSVVAKTETKTSKKNIQKKKLAANIDKVMAAIDDTIKDVAKNLEIKSIVKVKAMEGEVSLASYANQEFYIPKNIYLGNNLFDNRKIYNTVSLASYIANDPVNIKDNKLQDININKQRLLLEIQALKNG